ncbi:hypothetical protein CORC01_02569 [Colletotrichum orchidophilum]|uniref:Uncharacterized protein n=1 Tax=Colletotrichum orchidophilum TaxID=1209926 RepID=A0A1G4BKI6_9PEZI|nr:uncharacterized protein CORC01_02569 [Colletotrichum orchidophilum]OHF01990.1 hypothetical protein CORC01_02569 [Colletotrichum orchidophilum]
MPRNIPGKTTSSKPTMAPALRASTQSKALVKKAGAVATIKKVTASPKPSKKAGHTSDTKSQTEEVKEVEEIKKVEEPRFDTFHPFPRLPNEIKAMIICEYIDYEPAVIYGSCKPNKTTPGLIDVNTGRDGAASKYKCLTQLANSIIGFDEVIEREFGVSFHDLSRCPELGVRADKDLMVLVFDVKQRPSLDWYSAQQRRLNRSHFVVGIRNIGVVYDRDRLYGLDLNFNRVVSQPCAFGDLAVMVESFPDVKNFFILVKLRDGNKASQKQFLTDQLATAKESNHLMIFEEKERTWVEVTPAVARSQPRGDPLRSALDLLVRTDFLFHALSSVRAQPAHVRFRLLAASHFKNKTLGI